MMRRIELEDEGMQTFYFRNRKASTVLRTLLARREKEEELDKKEMR